VLLDRLLEALDVAVDAVAICDVRAGWRLSVPPAGSVGVHCVLSGSGVLVTKGEGRLELSPGTAIVVPPDTSQRIEPTGGARSTFDLGAVCKKPDPGVRALAVGEHGESVLVLGCGTVRVSYAGAMSLFEYLRSPLVVALAEDDPARAAFSSLLEEQARAEPGVRRMMSSYMTQVLVAVLRRLCEDGDCRLPWIATLDDGRLANAVARILEEPDAPHTLESLARAAGMSRSAFSARFSEVFRTSPIDFLRETRLRKAARLLVSTDLTVEAVAAKVGFSSRSHFSRAFRTFAGIDPARFRADAYAVLDAEGA
jgi:AraC-like DNA-binding protein